MMSPKAIRTISKTFAVLCAALGTYFVGLYVGTAASVYINHTPDKSPIFWYLVFLFFGIGLWIAAFFLWLWAKGPKDIN